MNENKIREKIIGGAYSVYNNMGYGFLESVYEKCMEVELKKAGFSYEIQKPIQVSYEGVNVGDFVLDLIVEDDIVVELKSVRSLKINHEVQLVNYLKATGKPTGLLINFGEDGVEVKRKYRDRGAIFE